MNIEPVRGVRLLMERPSYFSPEVIESTRVALKSVSWSSKHAADAHGLQPCDLEKESFGNFFSDTAHKDVDMDLDEYASRKHVHKIGLEYLHEVPPKDAPDFNVSPAAFTEAEMQNMDATRLEKLKAYPRSIPERDRYKCAADLRDDKRSNPQKYSLSQHCQRSVAGNAQQEKRDCAVFHSLMRLRQVVLKVQLLVQQSWQRLLVLLLLLCMTTIIT